MRIYMIKTGVISLKAMLVSAFCLTPLTVLACGQDAYFGQVCIMAGTYCPLDTLPAEGQLLPIKGNEALYSVLGITYGGDARTNFALPDLRGRAPVGQGQGTGLTMHLAGDKFGTETVTQSLAQMPLHNHAATFTGTGGSTLQVSVAIPTAAGNASTDTPGNTVVLAKPGFPNGMSTTAVKTYSTAAATTTLAPFNATVSGATGGGAVTVGTNGGGKSIPVVPPEVAIRYCVVTSNAIYPERPN